MKDPYKPYPRWKEFRNWSRLFAIRVTLFLVVNGLFFFLLYFLGVMDNIKNTYFDGLVMQFKVSIVALLYIGYVYGCVKMMDRIGLLQILLHGSIRWLEIPCLFETDDCGDTTGIAIPFCSVCCRNISRMTTHKTWDAGFSRLTSFGVDPRCARCGEVIVEESTRPGGTLSGI